MFRDSLPPATRVLALLVRHGYTALNDAASPRLRGWEDVPLDARGELAAQLAAGKLAIYKPKIVYSSDFQRDTQTARIIAERNGNIPLETDYGFRTADVGTLSGQKEDDARDRVLRWYQNPWEPAPSGESFNQFSKRFWAAYEPKIELARESAAFRPTVIVSHGRNIASLDSYYRGIPPEDALMPLPGGIAMVKSHPDGQDTLEFLGETEGVQTDA